MSKIISILVCMACACPVLAGKTYPEGESDSITPQVKLLTPRHLVRVGRPITVKVRFSEEFRYCADCATDPATDYAAVGQVDLRGHVHAYFQKTRNARRFPDDRVADSFCPFNSLNPSTVRVSRTVVKAECPPIEKPGRYRVCVMLETDAHTQRVKAAPRDFPPVDCQNIRVVRKRNRR